jgi:dihydrodipicolinate synthase/N-acetylneuraminate lyase
VLIQAAADIPAFEKHVVRVAQAGVGPLLSGSMSEAHHISADERTTLIRAARAALDGAELQHVPIVAGVGVGSTRESIALATQAAHAGADYAIAICSGYYAGALAADRAALRAFFADIADASPIPVMIYNCACRD